jgi:hypothetical protein
LPFMMNQKPLNKKRLKNQKTLKQKLKLKKLKRKIVTRADSGRVFDVQRHRYLHAQENEGVRGGSYRYPLLFIMRQLAFISKVRRQ